MGRSIAFQPCLGKGLDPVKKEKHWAASSGLTGPEGEDKRWPPMKVATVRSVCECQAKLEADLGEDLRVIAGRAQRSRRDPLETAPANFMGDGPVFQVGWFCPFCIRNTLRSFSTSGLAFREAPEPLPPTEPAT
jgi:hypothetical protein